MPSKSPTCNGISLLSNGDGLNGHTSGGIVVGDNKRDVIGAGLLIGMCDDYTTVGAVIPEVPCIGVDGAIGVVRTRGIKSANNVISKVSEGGLEVQLPNSRQWLLWPHCYQPIHHWP